MRRSRAVALWVLVGLLAAPAAGNAQPLPVCAMPVAACHMARCAMKSIDGPMACCKASKSEERQAPLEALPAPDKERSVSLEGGIPALSQAILILKDLSLEWLRPLGEGAVRTTTSLLELLCDLRL